MPVECRQFPPAMVAGRARLWTVKDHQTAQSLLSGLLQTIGATLQGATATCLPKGGLL